MNRRSVLTLFGVMFSPFAGCIGETNYGTPMNKDDLPSDKNQKDGYPPKFKQTPKEKPIDPSSFKTIPVGDVEVPLIPIGAAYNWYARREARFADARGPNAYERSHIFGAVLSPAIEGIIENDPVTSWPRSDKIVCYCGCPHHLSSRRAASLIEDGYKNVFVIEEGFWEWQERGYPMKGTEVTVRPEHQVIKGQVDPRFAGMSVWIFHLSSGQYEAARIASDGLFQIGFRFFDISVDSLVIVQTPSYQIAAPLSELLGILITEDITTSYSVESTYLI